MHSALVGLDLSDYEANLKVVTRTREKVPINIYSVRFNHQRALLVVAELRRLFGRALNEEEERP